MKRSTTILNRTLGWLTMFPGAALVAHFTGSDDVLLMFVPIILGFALIPVTLLLGFSRDVLRREEVAAWQAAR